MSAAWHGATYVWSDGGARVTVTLTAPAGVIAEDAPTTERHIGPHGHDPPGQRIIMAQSHDGPCRTRQR